MIENLGIISSLSRKDKIRTGELSEKIEYEVEKVTTIKEGLFSRTKMNLRRLEDFTGIR